MVSPESGPFDVSVVMIAHNEDRFIREALESIQRQTVPPVEVVVFNDCSTDRTAEIALSVPGPVPVRVVTAATNQGMIPARRQGVEETRSEWVAICDADDLWSPTKLEAQWELLRGWSGRRPVIALGTDGTLITEDGRPIGSIRNDLYTEAAFERWISSDLPLRMPHSSVVFRRADYDQVGGYDPTEIGVDDSGLWERFAERGDVLCLAGNHFSYRKKMGGGISTEYWYRRVNRERLILNRDRSKAGLSRLSYEETRALLDAQPFWKRVPRNANWKSGYNYERSSFLWFGGQKRAAVAPLLLSLALSPRQWFTRVRLRLSRVRVPQATR
jgi:glycosyltransferase involved in cell wall biosynthesis